MEPTVLLRTHGPIEKKLKTLNVTYEVIPYRRSTKPGSVLKGVIKRILNQIAVFRVASYIKRNRFNLVHNNSLLADMGMRAASRVHIPYISHMRELVKEDHGKEFYDEQRERDLVQKADRVIAISYYVAKKYHDWAPDEKLCVIHNGLDIDNYVLRHKPLFKNEAINLLLPGRVAPAKRQLDAVKAMEVLKKNSINANLVLVGSVSDANYMHAINTYINNHRLSDCVEVRDFIVDMADLYHWADISLMCSSHEAMGRVTVEGMLSGCLVIGADAGATPEIVLNNETGLLYKLGNPGALAERIEYAIEHKEEMQGIATHAQTWAKENFDYKKYANAITDMYQAMLA